MSIDPAVALLRSMDALYVCESERARQNEWEGEGFYMKRQLDSNLPDNEGYYTNGLILLVKNMLCSKLHYQKGFNLIFFFI